jgi:hypothetical protein
MRGEPSSPILILSGTVGVGKSTILNEIHAALAQARVPHACVDTDALAMSWPVRGAFNQIAVLDNLRSVWANAHAAGAERLVLAGVVESREDLDAYRRAVPGAQITVCQLVAPEEVRKSRLQQRELGAGLEWHLRRTEELRQILDDAAVHSFSVFNHGRSVQDVAYEALARAAWPVGQAG